MIDLVKQSDSNELKKNIARLKKTEAGVYSFFWAHPIKLPIKGMSNHQVMFWDRRNDEWIILEPIVISPQISDFDKKNINLLPNENDAFLLIGSFDVIIQKIDAQWVVKIKVIV